MLHFAENMKKLRKQSGVTQERLAEIFGVTPGAVYKWESGASIPDVEVIVFLAEFFDTSVDSLLGYSLGQRSAKKAIAYLTELYIQKNESLLLTELERVLEKYPNSFYVVYQCAHLRLSLAMLNDDKSSYRKAYCLLERSLELITQNDNPQIGEQTIRRNMASILLSLDKTEEAVGLLKRHNTDGINNSIIGFTLSRHGNPNEALTYLSKAFLTSLADSIQIFAGYANAYDRLDRPQDAIMALDWQTEALRGLRASDKPTI